MFKFGFVVFLINGSNWSLFIEFMEVIIYFNYKIIKIYNLEEDFIPVKTKKRPKAPAMIHKPTKKQR